MVPNRAVPALLLLASFANAQSPINQISCELVPNVAQVGGGPVEIRMFNNTASTVFQTGACDWYSIHPSLPTGQPDPATRISIPGFCTRQLVFTPPGQQINPQQPQSWNLNDSGQPVPAGTYWIESRVRDASSGALLPAQWFPLTVQAGPGEPTMTTTTVPRVGLVAGYAIGVPTEPNAPYAVLLGFTSNNPVGSVPFLGLDLFIGGPIFDASGLQTLDPSGNATFSMPIPNQPFLAQEGFVLQTLVFSLGALPFESTNAVSNSIR